ncbi:MAG: chemotaxis protein CheW [Ardenticatenales bacterium]|nr:chemotaxis protein CheW [Ardenticatenales bacterium]
MGETLYLGQDDWAGEDEQHERLSDLRSLITFELSGELYGVAITRVAEVREPLPLMPLPAVYVPPYVLGLINLRGVVLPVIDLRRRFGLPLREESTDTRLVILKGPGYLVALQIDVLHGLVRLPASAFQPAPPGVARVDPEYYDHVILLEGQMLVELNVAKMLTDTALQSEGR